VSTSVNAASSLADGTASRYLVACRYDTSLPIARPPIRCRHWKVKYTLPIAYPGNVSDAVHLAWEAADGADGAGGADGALDAVTLVQAVLARGLLGPVYRAPPPVDDAYHARLEWSTGTQHPLWTVYLQLRVELGPVTHDPADFARVAGRAARPRAPTDVPTWLAAVGATAAEWRVEIELRAPATTETISRALFLHHLLRQAVAPATAVPCLPRTQFVALYRQHLGGDTRAPIAIFARDVLRTFCREHRLPFNNATGYPAQPRPHDLTPRDLGRLNACTVTPKANGLEAFLVTHRYGYVILTRAGVVRAEAWPDDAWPVTPLLLEGELVRGDTFVAYDCLATPALAYVTQGCYETRHAALCLAVRRLGLPHVIHKPFFAFEPHPRLALTRCVEWARTHGVPCDGVIFADAMRPGYATTPRLWKLKHEPTIDFAVYACGTELFEVMLRGSPASTMQSLHSFRDARMQYELPVLLRPPDGVSLADGDVVELGLSVERDWAHGTGRVSFRTIQPRERGKQANFLVGGMDLVANGMTLRSLLQPDCPVLPRLVMDGPLRRARVRFLHRALEYVGPVTRVLDIGGGRGGDTAVWVHHPGLTVVDVVEPDPEALAEYRRRLVDTYGAEEAPHGGELRLPTGRRFRFHPTDAMGALRTTIAAGGGGTLAVLSFSVSQIVAHDDDWDTLLTALAGVGVAGVAIAAHDHVVAGLPDGSDGVACHPVTSETGRLRTRIVGSTTARDIHEHVFDAAALRRAVAERHAERFAIAWMDGPTAGGQQHWLLDSLVLTLLVPAH
jgi:hypothetical protein